MLHAKFQIHRTSGSGEEDVKMFFTIYGHGCHLGHETRTIYINFCSPFLGRLHMKFGSGELKMSHVTRISLTASDCDWISDHVLLLQKPGCTATEDGCRFKMLDVFIIYDAEIKALISYDIGS